MLQNTVGYKPVLLDHSTRTIINFEVFNARMHDHTRVGHVTGRCGGIDSESEKEKKRKEKRAEKNSSK